MMPQLNFNCPSLRIEIGVKDLKRFSKAKMSESPICSEIF